jgi:predicted O-methyltransferase YrrM
VIKAYLKYFFNRKKFSNIDDEFINELSLQVFNKIKLKKYHDIDDVYNTLKKNKSTIKISDFGAGSKKSNSDSRTISSIVKNAAIPTKFGLLLNELITYTNSKVVVELGTSLGIGTAYLAKNHPESRVYTIEGCSNIYKLARTNLSSLNLDNITFFNGEFSAKLEEVIAFTGSVDFVYIDGNHTFEATSHYFNYFLENMSSKGVLIFDDIHWSKGMEKAWDVIIKSKRSRVTIDLFRIGIVFLDPSLEKEHYTLTF